MPNFHGHRKLVCNYVPVVFNPDGFCINHENSFVEHHSQQSKMKTTHPPFHLNNDDETTKSVREIEKRCSLTPITSSHPITSCLHRSNNPLQGNEKPRVIVFERPSRWVKTSSRLSRHLSPKELSNQYMLDRCRFLESEQNKPSLPAVLPSHYTQYKIRNEVNLRDNTITLQKELERCCKANKIESDLRRMKSKSTWLSSYYGMAPLRKTTYADLLKVLDPLIFR